MGVEVLEADISPEQFNAIDIDDNLPEIDSKRELKSKHGFEEPPKSGLIDNSREVNGVNEVKSTNRLFILMDTSEDLGETKGIHEVESALDNRCDEIMGVEVSEDDTSQEQVKIIESGDSPLPEELNAERKETNEADSANLPKDAVDEWPAPKQIDRFCFVKFRPYGDPKLKSKIEQADKDLRKKNETRFQIIEALKAKWSECANVISQLKPLTGENKRYNTIIDEKRKEMEPLTAALGELRDMNSSGREKGIGLCSSDEELDGLEELASITEERDTSFRILSELRKEHDEANECFYKNRSLLSNAKILAAKKNKAALEELCRNEVERFMAQWNNNKAFRDDYERRILPSLDIRQLSRDGRRRNLDEKPIRMARLPNEVENASLKMTTSESIEKLVLPPQDNVIDKHKIQQEVKSSTEVEPTRQSDHLEGTEKNYEIESKELPKGNDVDLEKLKEMRREEEITKAKLAMERKKKLAEKAAAKAAARAQKEAEKRMKEKEKKAKKKAGILESATSDEQPETVKEKTSEADEAKVNADVYNPTFKKEPKAKVNFKARAKANQVPKVLLKKKKLQMYWTWAAPAAFFAVIFAIVGWYYFGRN